MSKTQSTMVTLGTVAPPFELEDVVTGKAVGRDDVFAATWDDGSYAANTAPGCGTAKAGCQGLLVICSSAYIARM